MTRDELNLLIPEVKVESANRYQAAEILYLCPIVLQEVTGFYLEMKINSTKSPAYITTDMLYLYEINFDERIIKGFFKATTFECVKRAVAAQMSASAAVLLA